MASEDIPIEVKKFIKGYIDSVGQLEILLLLHGEAEKEWSVSQINDELRSSLTSVEARLARLKAQGLVTAQSQLENLYRYSPKSAELAKAVDGLARIYKDFRGRVIDVIFSPPDTLKHFSDAFKFKEEKDSDG